MRTAIELALLGAKAVVIEKRDTFSRNNVLHLWPYTIHDLRGLGAKKFYGKFCAGAIDHISEFPFPTSPVVLTPACSYRPFPPPHTPDSGLPVRRSMNGPSVRRSPAA